jgi:hypothetical protein
MPKRIYTIANARAGLENGKRIAAMGPREKQRLFVLHGAERKRQATSQARVFDFLEKAFFMKPVGSRATYAAERKRGLKVEYVYEKAKRHYFLAERRYFSKGATKPSRTELLARPKNIK